MADYYDLLGVGRDADADTLKRSYRRLARQYHPVINKDAGAEDTEGLGKEDGEDDATPLGGNVPLLSPPPHGAALAQACLLYTSPSPRD